MKQAWVVKPIDEFPLREGAKGSFYSPMPEGSMSGVEIQYHLLSSSGEISAVDSERMILTVSGSAVLSVDGDQVEAVPNDFLYLARGVRCTWVVTPSTEWRIILFFNTSSSVEAHK